jgi:hypothetical protein
VRRTSTSPPLTQPSWFSAYPLGGCIGSRQIHQMLTQGYGDTQQQLIMDPPVLRSLSRSLSWSRGNNYFTSLRPKPDTGYHDHHQHNTSTCVCAAFPVRRCRLLQHQRIAQRRIASIKLSQTSCSANSALARY